MPLPLRYCSVLCSIEINRVLSIFKTVAVVGLFAVSSSLSQAQPNTDHKTIYKTVGKFGEIKYSQFAPESNTKTETIQMRSDGRPSQPGLFAPLATEPNKVSSKTVSDSTSNSSTNNPTATKPSDPNAATPSQCQKLRNNLSNLQLGGEIYESKSDGAHRYLTPSEVAVKVESTQKLLAQYCR
ncbi:DUF4124 domain-containing protein [Psychrobacter sp. UBA3962]|uniref:DUF4124 domain-containing protein n=1 Tax=Psychrobacter sp. UBA3962 TaxID=1947352 RepID=UPI0025DD67AC|nr:DUF4124 domain-containing protein [Psychrobacter sp. UBA3962]